MTKPMNRSVSIEPLASAFVRRFRDEATEQLTTLVWRALNLLDAGFQRRFWQTAGNQCIQLGQGVRQRLQSHHDSDLFGRHEDHGVFL